MKKTVAFIISLFLFISFFNFGTFALETTRPGTFFTEEQVAKSQEIKDKFGFDAILLYAEDQANDFDTLNRYKDSFIEKSGINEKYFVFAFNNEYYCYEWSDDLDEVFHSIDGIYIAKSIAHDNLSPSEIEDGFFDIIIKMTENRLSAPYKYIKDHAGVLTDSQEKAINEKLISFYKDNDADLVVVLTNGLDNGDYYNDDRMDYADDYYDYNGYSKDGALLLVNISAFDEYFSKNSWISTSGKFIGRISDDDVSDIGSKLTPILENGDYNRAVNEFITLVEKDIKDDNAQSIGSLVLIVIVVSVIVAFVYTGRLKKELKSVQSATEANDYLVDNSLVLTGSYDHFLYSHVTKTAKSSSNGSSSHTSSSGSSHGGGGF